jgi:hypothetical protein
MGPPRRHPVETQKNVLTPNPIEQAHPFLLKLLQRRIRSHAGSDKASIV